MDFLSELLHSPFALAVWTVITFTVTTWINGKRDKNNRDAENKRLHLQLDHDATQKQNDYEINLKKELVLDAVAAIGSMATILSNIGNMEINKITAINEEFSSKLNKVYMVINENSMKTLQDSSILFTSNFLTLIKLKAVIIYLEQEKNGQENLAGMHEKIKEDVLERMKEYNKNKENNKEVFESYNKSFDEATAENDKAWDSILKLNKLIAQKKIDLAKKCLEAGVFAQNEVAKIIIQMRKEINFELERPEEILENIEKSHKIMLRDGRAFIKDMENMIDDMA